MTFDDSVPPSAVLSVGSQRFLLFYQPLVDWCVDIDLLTQTVLAISDLGWLSLQHPGFVCGEKLCLDQPNALELNPYQVVVVRSPQ